jgi:hypothetical protein
MVGLPSYNLSVALQLQSAPSSLLGPCRAQKGDGSLSLYLCYGKEERKWVMVRVRRALLIVEVTHHAFIHLLAIATPTSLSCFISSHLSPLRVVVLLPVVGL